MDPISIALIATVILGLFWGVIVLIRQFLLGRDKKANDSSHRQALSQEAEIFGQIRKERLNPENLNMQIKSLNEIMQAIQYVDVQINALRDRKAACLEKHRHSEMALQADSADLIKVLPSDLNNELDSYEQEITRLNGHVSELWNSYKITNQAFLDQINDLKELSKEHTNILLTIIFRHIGSMELFGLKSIKAGIVGFKEILLSPFQQLFRLVTGGGARVATPKRKSSVDLQTQTEVKDRQALDVLQRELNESVSEATRYRFKTPELSPKKEEEGVPALIARATA